MPRKKPLIAFLLILQRKNKLTAARNHGYKLTDIINSEQSFLKSHPLWVNMYIVQNFKQYG